MAISIVPGVVYPSDALKSALLHPIVSPSEGSARAVIDTFIVICKIGSEAGLVARETLGTESAAAGHTGRVTRHTFLLRIHRCVARTSSHTFISDVGVVIEVARTLLHTLSIGV